MKKFRTDPDILKDLKKFCHGDFLQLAIGSLISICLKIPYHRSKEFLKDNIEVPVSFKKHIMRLQQTILDKPTIVSLLTDACIKEQNPSIRKVLLTKILEYFNYELEKESWWITLEKCIEDLNEKEIDSLETLGECKNIPKDYLSRYCKSIWNKILKFEHVLPGPQILKTRIEIISQVKNNIDYIDDTLIEVILEDNLFNIKVDENLSENLSALAVNYMFLKEGDKRRHAEFIQNIYSSIFQDQGALASATPTWDIFDEDKETYPMRELFSKFLKKIYETIIRKDKMNQEFIQIAYRLIEIVRRKNYPSLFFISHKRIFEYIDLYSKSNKNLLEFGKNLHNLINEEVKTYGNIIILKTADELQEFINLLKENMDENELKVEDLIEGLLNQTTQDIASQSNELLVYHLINKNEILNDKSVKRKYSRILELSKNVVVNLYLNNYYN